MEVQAQSRKLLLQIPPHNSPPAYGPARPNMAQNLAEADRSPPTSSFNSLNATVVLVLSILLCTLICALVLNAVVRCIVRIMNPVCDDQEPPGPLGPLGPMGQQPTKMGRAARKEALRALPSLVYSAGLGLAGAGSSECAICLSEFAHGEHVRVLPGCNHGFHVRCVDRWLAARPTCPTCRNCLFGSCVAVVVAADRDRAMARQREDIDL